MTHAYLQTSILSGKIDSKVKTDITQKCRFVIDTYPDKIRKLKQEVIEMEMMVDDAKDTLDKVDDLEVVL